MVETKEFNAKLMLFGEYGLLFGAKALAVPFSRFSGKLVVGVEHSNMESSAEILRFLFYLKTGNINQKLHFPLDSNAFGADLDEGLYFDSTIPQQYGLGSSAALIAALFDRYAHFDHSLDDEHTLKALKEDFALLESFFHRKSSGLDPLTSFLDRTVLFQDEQVIQKLSLDIMHPGIAVALVDTQETSETGPLVHFFHEQMDHRGFRSAFETRYIPANDGCIQSYLNRDWDAFFAHLHELILFQVTYLSQMIPDGFTKIITDALDQKVYIKLLGSGGGGYLLAFSQNREILERWTVKHSFKVVWGT